MGDTHRVCQAPTFGRCLHKRPSSPLVDTTLYSSSCITRTRSPLTCNRTVRSKRVRRSRPSDSARTARTICESFPRIGTFIQDWGQSLATSDERPNQEAVQNAGLGSCKVHDQKDIPGYATLVRARCTGRDSQAFSRFAPTAVNRGCTTESTTTGPSTAGSINNGRHCGVWD